MAPLRTFDTSGTPIIAAEPLTPESFRAFGGVISADHQVKHVESSAANYGTAIKLHKVAPVVDRYGECASGKPATANWNVFRCSAPTHLIAFNGKGGKEASGKGGKGKVYTSKVLERHPYSTQTFVPMGQDLAKVSYLVIVAKNDPSTRPTNYPSLADVKAFICKGNQSITYGAGVWHAPMVVVDETVAHIDFAVFIHENGVPDEDTQECYFDPGFSVSYSLENPTSKL